MIQLSRCLDYLVVWAELISHHIIWSLWLSEPTEKVKAKQVEDKSNGKSDLNAIKQPKLLDHKPKKKKNWNHKKPPPRPPP